jgi:xylulokinase
VDQLLLGVDMGTGSSKGVLTTVDGEVVATAHRKHGMDLPRPGWAEVDPETVWWGQLTEICRELAGQVDPTRIAGMCVSGVGPCLLLCDDALRPVRPAILYGIDMRSTAEIDELTARFGADRIIDRCGKEFSTQAVGPKITWVARNEPDAFAAARRWYNSSSYVAAKLTGAYVLDHQTASQNDPLYDLAARSWATDWMDEVIGHLEPPELVWPSDVIGTVTAEASAATGIPAGVPVSAGTVDAWAESFSAGVRGPGDVMLMYGSTMFFVQVLPEYSVHPKLWTTAAVDPGRFTIAGGMATSGSLTEWLQELTGGADFDQLVAEAELVPPGSDGVVVLPYFAGERTPIFDSRARGVVAGLSLRHNRGHLFRAAYEGIAFGIRQMIDFLDAPDRPINRLVAVGGGTQGGLWTQIVSDVLGRRQEVPEQTIGASYGCALMAAIGTGLVPPDTDWAKINTVVRPDLRHRDLYDELFRVYTELYPATRDHVHALSVLQESAAGG